FNRLVERLIKPFQQADAAPVPRIPLAAMGQGLVLTVGFWLLLGASTWAVFQAVLTEPPAWDWATWIRYSAIMALAYVAGFVIVVVPSGLGVREFLLTLLLIPEVRPLLRPGDADAEVTVLLAVVLLRVIWTAAEMVMVAIVCWLPAGASSRSAVSI